MKNDNPIITPSEINKYTYCPYQWYYERYYGTKKLRELYNARNEELGYADSNKSAFARGTRFHKNYLAKNKLTNIFKLFILSAVIFITVYLFYTIPI